MVFGLKEGLFVVLSLASFQYTELNYSTIVCLVYCLWKRFAYKFDDKNKAALSKKNPADFVAKKKKKKKVII